MIPLVLVAPEAGGDIGLGNSANGIDFPDLLVDVKVTSVKQPQSSCPFKSASQKVYGLGYSLVVFVYEKLDDHTKKTGRLNILHTIFIEADRTADYTMTRILPDGSPHFVDPASCILAAVRSDRTV